jgi:hypothetical protein
MSTKLILTLPGKGGVPGVVLDALEASLHAYYEKQGHPAYKVWGRIWNIEIDTVEDEVGCDGCLD